MSDVVRAVKKILKGCDGLLEHADKILNGGASNKAQGRIL